VFRMESPDWVINPILLEALLVAIAFCQAVSHMKCQLVPVE